MRLVDHEQPDALDEERQHPLAELGVVEPLGADEEQVDLVGGERLAHAVPVVAVRRVDGDRADAQAARGVDLVAHEREQGGDEHRRPGAAPPQQRGREEVHGALAPPGALHAQHAAAVVDEVAHRLELVLAERRVRSGELAQERERLVVQWLCGSGHPTPSLGTLRVMPDTSTAHEIAGSLRTRIDALREELTGYQTLRDELDRLEAALEALEPEPEPTRE